MAAARATESAMSSISNRKSARFSQASPIRSSTSRSALSAGPCTTAEMPTCSISASGKQPNTEASSTSPPSSAALARSMIACMGGRDGECTFMCGMSGRECQAVAAAAPFMALSSASPARMPVSYMSICG